MTDLSPPLPPPPLAADGGAAGLAALAGLAATPELAELRPRVIAFLIDWVGAYVAMFLAFAVVGGILGAVDDALGALFTLVSFVAYFGFGFWQIYQEGTTGQTIGKRLVHVQLVGVDNGGQPVGFALAFARNVVNGICGLFWLLPFVDARRQTVGDKVSKTVVVPASTRGSFPGRPPFGTVAK